MCEGKDWGWGVFIYGEGGVRGWGKRGVEFKVV